MYQAMIAFPVTPSRNKLCCGVNPWETGAYRKVYLQRDQVSREVGGKGKHLRRESWEVGYLSKGEGERHLTIPS